MSEQSTGELRKNFYKSYYGKLMPQLQKFDNLRKNALQEMILYVSFIILAMAFVFHFRDFLKSFAIVLLIIGLVAIGFIITKSNNEFVKQLKNQCMNPFLKSLGTISWNPEISIGDSYLHNSDLFAMYNQRFNDDYFSGVFNNVRFEIAETNLMHVSGSGKNRHVHQVFKGVVIKFKSNKTINNKTIVTTKGDLNTKNTGVICIILPIFCQMLIYLFNPKYKFSLTGLIISLLVIATVVIIYLIFARNTGEQLKPIHLEDPSFNKKFNVYSSDEIEARYLLTTSFMERFLNLKTAFGAKMVKCSFYDDNVMFAISTNKNLFEIGNLFHKLDNPKQIQRSFDEILSILLMIDYFKFNQKIGL